MQIGLSRMCTCLFVTARRHDVSE